MTKIRLLNWPLIIGLGAFGLVRPVVRIVQHQLGLASPPAVTLGLTVLVSVVWIAVVGLTRVREPLLTLLFAGLGYGLLSTLLSAALSPMVLEEMTGPLTRPFTIIPVLLVNAIWGLVTGALALALQRLRGVTGDRAETTGRRPPGTPRAR